jgi:GNAT superfamily N-acetyltransferase
MIHSSSQSGSSPATAASARRDVYPLECECDALLADGTTVRIRPIRLSDVDALTSFHDHLSSETVYRRFFGAHPHLRAEEVERFTRVDYLDRLALVAEVDGRLTGVARYDRLGETDRAEVALVVADALQGHGLGTLLIEHLAVAARRRGVAAFEAETLGTNDPMRDVFRGTGFSCDQHQAAGVVEVSFPIAPTQQYYEALLGRDLVAISAHLRPRLEAAGAGGLGLACRNTATAEALIAAGRTRGVEMSTVLVTDELGIDINAALAFLASGADSDVIAVETASLVTPRRVVALGREMTRYRPLLGFLSAGEPTHRCDQAGAEAVYGVEALIDRARELLMELRTHSWPAPARGRLVELPDCDSFRARAVLDTAATGPLEDGGSGKLARGQVEDLLATYGVSPGPFGRRGTAGGWSLILGHRAGDGLAAGVSAEAGTGHGLTRLLPLTDRDAEDLTHATSPADPAAVVEMLLRAARLIDDQPEISRIRIPLGPSQTEDEGLEVWTGPVRGTEDDPFVRRLVPRRAASARSGNRVAGVLECWQPHG